MEHGEDKAEASPNFSFLGCLAPTPELLFQDPPLLQRSYTVLDKSVCVCHLTPQLPCAGLTVLGYGTGY